MHFLMIALDQSDSMALERRMANREAHLANAKKYKSNGNILFGEAILDEDGKMIGSAVLTDFSNRAELDAWLESDPYVTSKVWHDITIYPLKAPTGL